MPRSALLELTDRGLFCPHGDFFIDPWRPVDRAVVTHAHADHLRWGCGSYLVSAPGERVTRVRLGPDAIVQTTPYGATTHVNGVAVSLHPAGHILGSAQVRIEHAGEVWVVSGDYKTGGDDPTCEPFEPVRCHGFVSESTFALPIYHWPDTAQLVADVNAWWRANAAAGKCSLIYGYSLGKAQRILSLLDPTIGPIFTHGAVEKLTQAYRDTGIALPPTEYAGVTDGAGKRVKKKWAGAIVVAPPSAHGSAWVRKFVPASAAFCSGWMTVRGTRRRKAVDRGFVVSDHADWPGLLDAITATGAERVWVTHGYTAVLVKYLRDRGLDAEVVETRFEGEAGGDVEPAGEPEA